MAERTLAEIMAEPWACLTCYARLTFGDLESSGKDRPLLVCPKCKSGDLHPASGTKTIDVQPINEGAPNA
jgi:hypothetical protein